MNDVMEAYPACDSYGDRLDNNYDLRLVPYLYVIDGVSDLHQCGPLISACFMNSCLDHNGAYRCLVRT